MPNFCFSVEFRIPCSACEEVHVERHLSVFGNQIPAPSLPFGWRFAGRSIYCPKHTIDIVVDQESRASEAS